MLSGRREASARFSIHACHASHDGFLSDCLLHTVRCAQLSRDSRAATIELFAIRVLHRIEYLTECVEYFYITGTGVTLQKVFSE